MNTNGFKSYFTEDEWDAIYNALAEYQDHGDDEAELADSAMSKIADLFEDESNS